MANTKAELVVFSHIDPRDRVDVLPRRVEPTTLDEIGGPGAGSFSILAADPKLIKDPDLLHYRSVIKSVRNGRAEDAFVIQIKKEVYVGQGEAADKVVKVSGEGLKTWFHDAVVYPFNGIQSSSLSSRVFSFASPEGSWYNAADWEAPVIVAPYEMEPPAGSANPWMYRPAEWPDVPNASWVWSQINSNAIPAPVGVNYFRYTFTVAQPGKYSVFAAADNTLDAFMDGAIIIESDTDRSMDKTFRADVELTAGTHILAFRVANTGDTAALIASLFRNGDATNSNIAQLITYTGQAGWLVNGYPAVEPGWTVGEILLTLLAEADARGVDFPNWLTPRFTEDLDSNGVPWASILPWEFGIGSDYAEVLAKLEEFTVDVWIDPETYELNVYNARSTDRSIQTTTGQPVILREGFNLTKASEAGQAEIKNTLLVQTEDGWIEANSPSSTSVPTYGRVEGQLSTSLPAAASRDLAAKVFTQKDEAEEGATYEIHPRKGAVPRVDFFTGDWLLAPNSKGLLVRRRVMSISTTETRDNGEPVYSIEFDTIFQDRERQIDKFINRAAGGGVGGGYSNSGPSTGGGTPVTTPGGVIESIPKAPTGVAATSVGLWDVTGAPASVVTVSWNPVTETTTGTTGPGVSFYEVLGEVTPEDNSEPLKVRSLGQIIGTQTSMAIQLPPGYKYTFYVLAYFSYNRVSARSTPVTHVASMPLLTLEAPDAPVLTTAFGTVTIKWNGFLDGGDTPPAQFKYVYAEASVAEDGAYTPVAGTLSSAGATVATGLTIGDQYWIRLVAVDNLSYESEASTAMPITVEGIDLGDIGAEIGEAVEGAVEDAALALAAANGKNRIIYSELIPSGLGNPGDTWFKRTPAGVIEGQWEWGKGYLTTLSNDQSFEAVGNSKPFRKNFLRNPSGRRSAAGWSGVNATFGYAPGANGYASGTTAQAAGGVAVILQTMVIGVDVKPNTQYTFSIDLFASSLTVAAYVDGPGISTIGYAITTPGGGWARAAATFTTGASGSFLVYVLSGSATPINWVWGWRDGLIEEGAVALPYFDGASTSTAAQTNQWAAAPDASPSIQYGVLMRRNLFNNPSAKRGSTGYGAVNGTLVSEPGNDHYLSLNPGFGAGNAYIIIEAMTIGGGKLVAGGVYTFSAWIYSAGVSVSIFAGGPGVTSGGAQSTIKPAGGGFTRYSVTFTASPSGLATFYVLNSSTTATGNLIAFFDALLEEGSELLPYFDGIALQAGTVDDSDIGRGFVGVLDNSMSVMTAVAVPNTVGGVAKAISSTQWSLSGSRSLRVRSTYNAVGGFAEVNLMMFGPLSSPAAAAGKTFTILVTSRTTAARSNPPRIQVTDRVGTGAYRNTVADAPNTIGVHEIRLTVTILAGATELYIRLYSNVISGQPDVWFDNFLIVEVADLAHPYEGAYFVGSIENPGADSFGWVSKTISGLVIANIDAGKITTGFLSGDRILANSIGVGKLMAGAVQTNNLEAGSVTTVKLGAEAVEAGNIKADAITSIKIEATAIDGKTITGALVRSAATGARTEMTNQGFRALDAAGNELVKVGYGISSGMAVRSPQTGVLVPLAPLVLGTMNWQETWNVSPGNGAANVWGGWMNPKDPNNGVFQASSPTGRFLVLTNITAPINTQQDAEVRMQAGFYLGAMGPSYATNLVIGVAQCTASGEYSYNGMTIVNLTPNVLYSVRPLAAGRIFFGAAQSPLSTSMSIVVIPL